jgi:hypothetical protein
MIGITILQETLAAQQLMLTQVCNSLQQLAASTATQQASPAAGSATTAMQFVANQAGFGGALALQVLRRLASEADLTAAVLSHKILLADSSPAKHSPGRQTCHLTVRCELNDVHICLGAHQACLSQGTKFYFCMC